MAKIVIINEPDLEEAGKTLQELLDRGAWISLYCSCMVEYEGRGYSRSTWGDKHIMIKPSGSIIIHGHKGFRPENWQPDNSIFTLETSEYLVIKSIRKKPRETLNVICRKIYGLMALEDFETGEFVMYVDEHEIRDYLIKNPEIIEQGFRPVKKEKPVEPGFIDIYGIDSSGIPVVVEIKRVKASVEAVKQLEKYLLALEKHGVKARGILVAPGFTESAIKEAYRARIKLVSIDPLEIRKRLSKKDLHKRRLTDYF